MITSRFQTEARNCTLQFIWIHISVTKLNRLKYAARDHYQIILDKITDETLQFKNLNQKPKMIIGNPVRSLPNLTITITDLTVQMLSSRSSRRLWIIWSFQNKITQTRLYQLIKCKQSQASCNQQHLQKLSRKQRQNVTLYSKVVG